MGQSLEGRTDRTRPLSIRLAVGGEGRCHPNKCENPEGKHWGAGRSAAVTRSGLLLGRRLLGRGCRVTFHKRRSTPGLASLCCNNRNALTYVTWSPDEMLALPSGLSNLDWIQRLCKNVTPCPHTQLHTGVYSSFTDTAPNLEATRSPSAGDG